MRTVYWLFLISFIHVGWGISATAAPPQSANAAATASRDQAEGADEAGDDAKADDAPSDDSTAKDSAAEDASPRDSQDGDEASRAPVATPDDTKASQQGDTDAGSTKADEGPQARFQMKLRSFREISDAFDRAALRPLIEHLVQVAGESADRSSDVELHQRIMAFWEIAENWPDCETELAVFGADREGRPRVGKRLSLPVGKVHDLVQDMLEDERLVDFLDGAELNKQGDQFVLTIGGEVVAYLRADGTSATLISTHEDLKMPAEFFPGAPGEGDPLLAARLTFEKTEKDSGETFFSKLTLIQSVDYTLRSQADGSWLGELRVNWPPVLGLAVKPFVGRTKQTFFVPDDAFAGGVAKVTGMGAALDQVVGFEQGGPFATRASDDLCVVVMPGTGWLPVPDVALQCRLRDTDDFAKDVRKVIKKLNRKAKKQDREPQWHSGKVANREVFWSDNRIEGRAILPFIFRPVFFVQQAEDAKERERDYLVIGLTTTRQKDFVQRWLNLARPTDARFLPSTTGLNGDIWLNWREIYDWLIPYINTGMSGMSPEFVIGDQVGKEISDGTIQVKVTYQGLRVIQDGPVPLGLMSLPGMVSSGLRESSGTDLARERIAARRLKVLHHHSKLFHQDIGRWPSRVAELDGYVDFAGHKYLLKLESSPKKKWGELMEGIFSSKDDKKEADEDESSDDPYAEIDDSLYVVIWDEDDHWALGFKEDKFDHLQQLYIDEAGNIHRVEKVETDDETKAKDDQEAQPDEDSKQVAQHEN